jgi:hypothetical protein
MFTLFYCKTPNRSSVKSGKYVSVFHQCLNCKIEFCSLNFNINISTGDASEKTLMPAHYNSCHKRRCFYKYRRKTWCSAKILGNTQLGSDSGNEHVPNGTTTFQDSVIISNAHVSFILIVQGKTALETVDIENTLKVNADSGICMSNFQADLTVNQHTLKAFMFQTILPHLVTQSLARILRTHKHSTVIPISRKMLIWRNHWTSMET